MFSLINFKNFILKLYLNMKLKKLNLQTVKKQKKTIQSSYYIICETYYEELKKRLYIYFLLFVFFSKNKTLYKGGYLNYLFS